MAVADCDSSRDPGATRVRPVALGLGIVSTGAHLVLGLWPFVSPGHDAFEAIGYLFGIVLLGLAATAAVGTIAAARGRSYAGVFVAPPVLAGLLILWLAVFD
jgi:hypothetical protein